MDGFRPPLPLRVGRIAQSVQRLSYGLDGGDEIFRPSRPALGPIQPLLKWVPSLSEGRWALVKCGRAVLLTNHPPSSAAVMEEQSYTSTHSLGHTGPVTGTLYFFFYYPYLSQIYVSATIKIFYMQYKATKSRTNDGPTTSVCGERHLSAQLWII